MQMRNIKKSVGLVAMISSLVVMPQVASAYYNYMDMGGQGMGGQGMGMGGMGMGMGGMGMSGQSDMSSMSEDKAAAPK